MSTDKKQPEEALDSGKADSEDQAVEQEASSDIPQLTHAERELVDAQDKAEENWEMYLRTAAELENFRKRSQREVENARRYGIERFAQELLTVRDSLEMGLEAASEEPSGEVLMAGQQATLKQLEQLMERFTISEFE